MLLSVLQTDLDLALTELFEATSVPIAHGRNIVNVILVDYRAIDTLGEISVVMAAGMAITGADHAFGLPDSRRKRLPDRRRAKRRAGGPPHEHRHLPHRRAGLTALMLVFSIFVLLRGHNEPGGGFIGGLIGASGLAIYGIACGVRRDPQGPARPSDRPGRIRRVHRRRCAG